MTSSIQASNYNGVKSFNIHLFGVDPVTLDKSSERYSFLNFKLATSMDWALPVTKDLPGGNLIISGSNPQSLVSMRSVSVNFSTQISFAELSVVSSGKSALEVYNSLLSVGFINSERVPTGTYTYGDIVPIDGSFDILAIENLMVRHYFWQIVTFNLVDFLELNSPPIVSNNSLQTQINKLGQIKINSEFSFNFAGQTFIDPDGDSLTYTAQGLPVWLVFLEKSSKFLGTPTKDDLGESLIKVIASDEFHTVTDIFKLSVQKQKPQSSPLGGRELVLGNSLLFTIPTSTFVDPEGGDLTFNATLVVNGSLLSLPAWLSFDQSRLYGSPRPTDVYYDNTNKKFYQEFEIRIFAIDIADQTADVSFILTVINHTPKLNPGYSLASQFQSYRNGEKQYFKIGEPINFVVDARIFSDDDGDTLSFSSQGFPQWLNFNSMKLSGSPSKNDIGNFTIGIVCSDGYSSIVEYLTIQVNNLPPTANSIQNHTLILGNSLIFTVNQSAFSDPRRPASDIHCLFDKISSSCLVGI